MSTKKIGLIGAGKMATALATGLIKSGYSQAIDLLASDQYDAARTAFTNRTNAPTTSKNGSVIDHADVIILAVKPQVVPAVLDEIATIATDKHLFISIAAGVTLQTLERSVPQSRHIRVMPNTPALVSAGASAYALGAAATSDDGKLVNEILNTVGLAIELPEALLDAVTGLSGSGPAYVFEIIEALSDGGVLMGLPRLTATQLAAQTLLGAAKMVLETGDHPGLLKDAVTSPGGTTIAGLHELERGGLRGILMNAVQAATRRSRELGKNS